MVVDSEREKYLALKIKSDYLKECLWQDNSWKNLKEQTKRARKRWLFWKFRTSQTKWQRDKANWG